ncbi:TRAF3-interacting JNK-activating modulator [Amia ocellicauda]|uniref:TRAF3-interacting JNK-activating modulator n=1 Tax=Amia ocellicauda TaxID=2972642 RepID=UPI0034641329
MSADGRMPQKTKKRSWMPGDNYDQKVDQRVTRHEYLRSRLNVTTCRNDVATRDSEWRSGQQRKRQQEFLKRRQISQAVGSGEEEKPQGPTVVLRSHERRPPLLNRRSLVMSQELGITWPDLSSVEEAPWLSPSRWKESRTVKQNVLSGGPSQCISAPLRHQPLREERVTQRRERGVQTEEEGFISNRNTQRDSSAQTESGIQTVKEKEILELSNYLREALQRESALKQKLSVLQHIASTLLLSSDKLWTTRCNEDLMKCKIGSLEAQLQVCVQKYSRDGVKRALLEMEEQKIKYEEKAKVSIQRAILDKQAAEEKLEGLQEALVAAQREAAHWQGQYEEMRQSCTELKRSHELNMDQLHLLQSQLERAAGQEASLRGQVETLRRDGEELLSQISALQEDNHLAREQLDAVREKLRIYEEQKQASSHEQIFNTDTSSGILNSSAQPGCLGHRMGTEAFAQGDVNLRHQLQDTEQKLGMKEKECAELQAELEEMELECQSCQSRLHQCRDELKLLQGRRRQRCCSAWLCLPLLVLLLALLVSAAFHPLLFEHMDASYRAVRWHVEQQIHRLASGEQGVCEGPPGRAI